MKNHWPTEREKFSILNYFWHQLYNTLEAESTRILSYWVLRIQVIPTVVRLPNLTSTLIETDKDSDHSLGRAALKHACAIYEYSKFQAHFAKSTHVIPHSNVIDSWRIFHNLRWLDNHYDTLHRSLRRLGTWCHAVMTRFVEKHLNCYVLASLGRSVVLSERRLVGVGSMVRVQRHVRKRTAETFSDVRQSRSIQRWRRLSRRFTTESFVHGTMHRWTIKLRLPNAYTASCR